MAWKLDHKCFMSDSEPRDFAVLKTVRDGRKVTVMQCENPQCREVMVVLGHELFAEAVHADRLGEQMPPGFWIPRTARRT